MYEKLDLYEEISKHYNENIFLDNSALCIHFSDAVITKNDIGNLFM